MGVKCSLLGHNYGAPETERDRDERGDEVVITTRELRRCARCGEVMVTSESTEVRPVEPAPETVDGGTEAETGPGADDDGWGTGGGPSPAAGGAGFASDEDDEPAPASDPETDDGIILDTDEADEERAPGEWPDASDTRLEEGPSTEEAAGQPTDSEASADAADTDEASPADRASDDDGDAEIIGAGDDEPSDDEPAAAQDTPEPDASTPEGDWPDPEADDGVEDEGFDASAPDDANETDAEVGPAVDAEADASEPTADDDDAMVGGLGEAAERADGPTVFVCPSCGYEVEPRSASHRPGDVCPQCTGDYLEERSE
ncbi:MAG: hypothetical protein ABEJ35_07295 [Halobacteriaceae archaeon]